MLCPSLPPGRGRGLGLVYPGLRLRERREGNRFRTLAVRLLAARGASHASEDHGVYFLPGLAGNDHDLPRLLGPLVRLIGHLRLLVLKNDRIVRHRAKTFFAPTTDTYYQRITNRHECTNFLK